MSQKIVLKVHLNCKKCRRRAMKTIAGTKGVDSIVVDDKDSKITVIGDPDPVCLIDSLRQYGYAELVSVGPSKEPEKKPEPKKAEEKKKPEPKQIIEYVVLPTSSYYPCDRYTYYCSQENPSACSIQ